MTLAYPFRPPPPDPQPGAHRAHALGQGALTLAGLGGVLLAARAVSLHAPACPFRTVTGVPCPGCGMTRLASAVAHGHVVAVVQADVAGVTILVVIAVLATVHVTTVVIRKRPPPRWLRSRAVPLLIGALVLAHWLTTIVTGGLPST